MKQRILILLLTLLSVQQVVSQSVITGTVKNADGDALDDVSVTA